MSYAVSVCPRCGRRKVFQAPAKTTGCPWCGKRHAPARTMEYETLDEARAAMSAAGAERSAIEPSNQSSIIAVPGASLANSRRPSKRPRLETVSSLAEALTKELGLFTGEQFAERAAAGGIADPKGALKMLADAGYVVEPKAGRYRSV